MMETERLFHRKFTLEDLDKLIELRSDNDVIKYLGGRRMQNPENIEKRLHFYRDCYEKYGFGMCALVWKPTGEMIGWSGLQPLEKPGKRKSLRKIKGFWGKGIGYETALGWLRDGLKKSGLEKSSPSHRRKHRFVANMEKLGMRREKN